MPGPITFNTGFSSFTPPPVGLIQFSPGQQNAQTRLAMQNYINNGTGSPLQNGLTGGGSSPTPFALGSTVNGQTGPTGGNTPGGPGQPGNHFNPGMFAAMRAAFLAQLSTVKGTIQGLQINPSDRQSLMSQANAIAPGRGAREALNGLQIAVAQAQGNAGPLGVPGSSVAVAATGGHSEALPIFGAPGGSIAASGATPGGGTATPIFNTTSSIAVASNSGGVAPPSFSVAGNTAGTSGTSAPGRSLSVLA